MLCLDTMMSTIYVCVIFFNWICCRFCKPDLYVWFFFRKLYNNVMLPILPLIAGEYFRFSSLHVHWRLVESSQPIYLSMYCLESYYKWCQLNYQCYGFCTLNSLQPLNRMYKVHLPLNCFSLPSSSLFLARFSGLEHCFIWIIFAPVKKNLVPSSFYRTKSIYVARLQNMGCIWVQNYQYYL